MKVEKPESFYILVYLLELIIKIWQFGNTIRLSYFKNLKEPWFS
jgi:hypothetical protein